MGFERDDVFQKIVQQKVVIPKFYRHVWPNCQIIESDLQDNNLAKTLDIYGIDKFIKGNSILYGLSQRIQRGKYSKYRSITIRKTRINGNYVSNSEYYKSLLSMKTYGITAAYQSQCYVNANKSNLVDDIIWGIIVKKPELYKWMDNNPDKVYKNFVNERGQTQTFLYVYGIDLDDDVIVAIYENKTIKSNGL
jgi:hypothetical protein